METKWALDGRRILSNTGREVAVATRADPLARHYAEKTAARIVQCCNSHDALVAALEGMLKADFFAESGEAARDAARAALKLAREE